MKILVVSQHYAPEPFRLPDLCEALVAAGHTVKVVTDVPNYPEGYIYPEYKNGKRRDEIINGVPVHRTFTVGRRKNVIFRFLNYYSWRFSAGFYLKNLKEDFDVVLSWQTSPVMMSQPALDYAKKNNKRVLLYCLDIWPACLKAGGIGSGPIFNYFKGLSRKIYSSADRILVSSEMFIDYFRETHGIGGDVIAHLPQYAEAVFEELTDKTGDDRIELTFAGNVGKAQSVETIIEAASLVADDRIRWNIVGDGSSLPECKRIASDKGLTNVIFHGRHPLSEMPAFYERSDAMLLTLCDDEIISYTLPGKVQTYMAASKPVIAAAGGESRLVIEKADCGYCTAPDDACALAESVKKFAALSREERKAMGKRASDYYRAHFAKEIFISEIISELSALAAEG